MTTRNGSRERITAEENDKWVEGWTSFMIDIWLEQMRSFSPPVERTGALRNSLKGEFRPGDKRLIEFEFLEYGAFVAKGITPAFAWKKWTRAHGGEKVPRERVPGGQLDILDPQYRRDHGLDKEKKTGPKFGGRASRPYPVGHRDWFAKKFYASLKKLNEHEQWFYGADYQGLMSEAMDMMFSGGNSMVAKVLKHIL